MEFLNFLFNCRGNECRGNECRGIECRGTECRGNGCRCIGCRCIGCIGVNMAVHCVQCSVHGLEGMQKTTSHAKLHEIVFWCTNCSNLGRNPGSGSGVTYLV